ncbi:probable G-protein coupled receptor 139 [Chiloscyllium plagiosum]|uniref:probable G-protein coupled receptor 139 n=1 Tax=Chiloscyllium plagiosum TaxID=36176 RepID=UPI001CB857FF|nr:probable G-protein coupled receptor 139 [Chiloscyllium plagiosum]
MYQYFIILQIEFIYYTVIAVLGTLANSLAIVVLCRGKCNLSKCITCYLVGMAAADLLVVTSDVILFRICYYYPGSFLDSTPVCCLNEFLRYGSTTVSVWLTVAFTFDRFVIICWQHLKTKYCTARTSAVVIGTVTVLGYLECVPWYFRYEPRFVINNIPWRCSTALNLYISPLWTMFELFHRILVPCVPFVLILLLNSFTIRHILLASKIRKSLRGSSNGEDHKDPEIESRRKSIILLFSISGSFILLWLTDVVFYMYQRISNMKYFTANDPAYIVSSSGAMLQLLSSCTNTCIYAVTQTKFREELKNVMVYPFHLIVKLLGNN